MEKFAFFKTILSILIVLIVVTFFFFNFRKNIFNQLLAKSRLNSTQTRQILFMRIFGFVFFGIIPAFIIIYVYKLSMKEYGLTMHINFLSFILILLFGGFFILLNSIHAKSKENLKIYPQIRIQNWNYSLLIISAFSWLVYLFAYEFMFRGFLFFSCINEMGIFVAIFINITLYAFAHLTKSTRELIGAIPMGIILCYITYYSKSFIPAFWIHSCLAISNEWYSIKYNSVIKINKNW